MSGSCESIEDGVAGVHDLSQMLVNAEAVHSCTAPMQGVFPCLRYKASVSPMRFARRLALPAILSDRRWESLSELARFTSIKQKGESRDVILQLVRHLPVIHL